MNDEMLDRLTREAWAGDDVAANAALDRVEELGLTDVASEARRLGALRAVAYLGAERKAPLFPFLGDAGSGAQGAARHMARLLFTGEDCLRMAQAAYEVGRILPIPEALGISVAENRAWHRLVDALVAIPSLAHAPLGQLSDTVLALRKMRSILPAGKGEWLTPFLEAIHMAITRAVGQRLVVGGMLEVGRDRGRGRGGECALCYAPMVFSGRWAVRVKGGGPLCDGCGLWLDAGLADEADGRNDSEAAELTGEAEGGDGA